MSTPTPADDRSTAPDADVPPTVAVDEPVAEGLGERAAEGDAVEQSRTAVPGRADDLQPVGDREVDAADLAEGSREVPLDEEERQ